MDNSFCIGFTTLRIFWDKKMVIHGDILVDFLRILSTKSPISQKIKVTIIRKLFAVSFWTKQFDKTKQFFFRNYLHIFYYKVFLWSFWDFNNNKKFVFLEPCISITYENKIMIGGLHPRILWIVPTRRYSPRRYSKKIR